jgi:hypothetical protein
MKHLCLTKQCGLFGGGELAAVDGCDVCRMEATEGFVDGVFHLFGYWGVEVFLFVSGFGIVYSLYRNDVSLCDSIHVYPQTMMRLGCFNITQRRVQIPVGPVSHYISPNLTFLRRFGGL